jgi:dihydroflavonol-4-reductase
MKIFITGATGFIGKQLVRRLSQTEHRLFCLARSSSNVDELKNCRADIVIGDITDKNSLLKGMRGCNWVVNLANLYSFWEPDPQRYTEINVQGTQNVMECALETGISKIVHLSTYVIYESPAESPFCEETSFSTPHKTTYVKTKFAGDLIAWELYEKKGLPLVVIYPGNVLGRGDDKPTGSYIKDLINRKFPARLCENSYLTFVCVGDVVAAIVQALEKEDNIGEKYLIGREQKTVGEFNKTISSISGVPLPKFVLPDSVSLMAAHLLTFIADVIKKPPLYHLSKAQIKTILNGFKMDGRKAERELGIVYTPVQKAIEEAIAAYSDNQG